jgi:hypothetical protein
MNYNIRTTDPQATVQGRTFAVRAVMNQMLGAPDFLLVEMLNGDWQSVGENSQSLVLIGTDFDTEEGTVNFLKKVVDWLNTNFTRLLGIPATAPVPAGALYGDGGRVDTAIQRIRLVVTGDTIVAKL